MRFLNSQSGQATTAAMILLPVVMIIATSLVVLGFAFIFEAKASANCRGSLGESQLEARRALEHLLALNPKAEKLEQARQAAILSVELALASGDAFLLAAAELKLRTVEHAQIPVMAAQLRWITNGRTASMTAAIRADRSIREALPEALIRNSKSVTDLTHARFDVVAGPAGARTPTYRPAAGFEKSQRAEVRWLLSLPNLDDENELSPSINVGCAMTLTKEGADAWSPKILEDKLLPN